MVSRRLSNDSVSNSPSKSSPSKRHLRSKSRGRYNPAAYRFDFESTVQGISFDVRIPVIHCKDIKKHCNNTKSIPTVTTPPTVTKDKGLNGSENSTYSNEKKDQTETLNVVPLSNDELVPAPSLIPSISLPSAMQPNDTNNFHVPLSDSNKHTLFTVPVSTPSSISSLPSSSSLLPKSTIAHSATNTNSSTNRKTVFTLFSYAGIPTGRRHTPDPLAADSFELFHKHMSRVEKRSRFQERELSVSEHARLAEIKEELNNNQLWKSVLPTVTRIKNPRSRLEMEEKRKKTLDEIGYYLKRYSQFKALEKKVVQAANATVVASAAAGVGVIDLTSSNSGRSRLSSSRRNNSSRTTKTQIPSTISVQHRKGKIEQLIKTKGMTHNTFDDEEPGVDSMLSDEPGAEFSDDEDGHYDYQWEYDGAGVGIRATQK